ncbi:TPA: hypothetical protein ACH3X2_007445 [Trebouxia sp. C0005]
MMVQRSQRHNTLHMADPQLFYISKQFANFPSLQSVELSEAEIVQLVAQLCEESERIVHDAGHDAELVCNISHNNLTYEHFELLTKLLLDSSVHLFALDLSWNRIFARSWDTFLPTVTQLLTIAAHIDLAGNHLPALQPDDAGLVKMLEQDVSFAVPNIYLGKDKWVQRWTEKAQDFRRQAYGEEPELDSDH